MFKIGIIAIALLLCSCVSTRRYNADVLSYQRQVALLEARVDYYENTIRATVRRLESIRGTAESIDGTVDELIRLFDEYQRTVEQLIEQNRIAAAYTESQAESD